VEPAPLIVPSGARPAVGGEPWLRAARSLHAWMRERDYAGHDPHDTLASPIASKLTFGSRWLGVAWTQLGKRGGDRTRRLLRVPVQQNAKGMGLVLGACTRLSAATGEPAWREEGRGLVQWLSEAAQRTGDRVGWGYPFPWANRDFYAPAGTPSSVASAFIGHALLDAEAAWGDTEAGELARGAARFMLTDLNRVAGGGGRFAFSYTPLDRRVVHNASLLAASLLARVAAADGSEQHARAALAAAEFTLAAQGEDGSWPYGLGRRNGWVDSFHTSYVLQSLDTIARCLGIRALDQALHRGIQYWWDAFLGGPAVSFYPERPYPVDLHAVAHTILALRALEPRCRGAAPMAGALGAWSLRVMRDEDGSFYYRQNGDRTDRSRYMRWTQAWMLLALAELASWEDG
jgi:hypothetical protein